MDVCTGIFTHLYHDVAAEKLVAEVRRHLEVDVHASSALLVYRRNYPKRKVHVVCDPVPDRQIKNHTQT